MGMTLADFGAVMIRWRTWLLMARHDIEMRYRRSLLGPFWISISLAATIAGLALLYGAIFAQDQQQYLYYLSCGFTVWALISSLVLEGAHLAIESEGHLRSLRIPLPVLAARMVCRNAIVFGHNLIIIAALTALFGLRVDGGVVISVLGVGLVLAAGFFLSLILGPLCLRFRDIFQVLSNVLQLSFFLTPILWMPEQGRVPALVYEANPLFHYIEMVRAPILGHAPTALNWAVSVGGVIVLAIGAFVSTRYSRQKLFMWL